MNEQRDPTKSTAPVRGEEARREFIKRSGKAALAAPAAALLLSVSSTNLSAQVPPYNLDNTIDGSGGT